MDDFEIFRNGGARTYRGVALVGGVEASRLDARDGVAQRGLTRAQLGAPTSRHSLSMALDLFDSKIDERLFKLF